MDREGFFFLFCSIFFTSLIFALHLWEMFSLTRKSEDPKIILKELHVPNIISWSKLKGLLRFCSVF